MNKEEARKLQTNLDEFVDMMNVKWKLFNQCFLEKGLGDTQGHFERCTYDGFCQAIVSLGGFWGRTIDGNHAVALMGLTSGGSQRGQKDKEITAKGIGRSE